MPTSQVQIVMPTHINSSSRLFGGQLMAWIDVVASVEAWRHAKCNVTTASVDHLDFLGPVFLGDIVRLDARVIWTGKTSIEVAVESLVESSTEAERLINRAFLVFVALDKDGKPKQIPQFTPQTDQAKVDFQAAILRREHRLMQKNNS